MTDLEQIRPRFAAAIEANDLSTVERMLGEHRELANADLRAPEDRDAFTNGFPLHRACENAQWQLAEVLLEHGADPDAPGSDPDDRPEIGIPLHCAVCDRNYALANLLLDHGANPNSYPYCDKSTIERLFYHVCEVAPPLKLIRRAYAQYLPDREVLEQTSAAGLVASNAKEEIRLFARMLDVGAEPPFTALVRGGFHNLLMEIVEHSPDTDGTPHDHPKSQVFDNIFGAARWYGYPTLLKRLIELCPARLDYGRAIETISTAIGSHNRDGGYPEYRQIIVIMLERLKTLGALKEAKQDPEFNPLYQIATDFCWHRNYGYKAEIVEPECYVDLAELFVAWGFGEIDYRDPESGHSPLSAAVKRGHHPGIGVYIQWLVDRGADLREGEVDELNPRVIARESGLDEIARILA